MAFSIVFGMGGSKGEEETQHIERGVEGKGVNGKKSVTQGPGARTWMLSECPSPQHEKSPIGNGVSNHFLSNLFRIIRITSEHHRY